MRYKDFEDAFSAARLNKYKNACGGNTNKALTLAHGDFWLYSNDGRRKLSATLGDACYQRDARRKTEEVAL